MSTVNATPSSATAGVIQKISGYQDGSGNQIRPNSGYPTVFSTTAYRMKLPQEITRAGTMPVITLPQNNSLSVAEVYNNASMVLRSRSPANDSAATTVENIKGKIKNMGANM